MAVLFLDNVYRKSMFNVDNFDLAGIFVSTGGQVSSIVSLNLLNFCENMHYISTAPL